MKSLAVSPAAVRRARWLATARPAQLPPPGDWQTWLVLAGRGFGKTRTAAEDAAWYGSCTPGAQIAMVAPTFGDVRGTLFEGISGLMHCLAPEVIAEYNRSRLEVRLVNGTIFRGFSADTPDRLRGPQFHRAYCDELAVWAYPEAWDQLLFALRLGDYPRVIVTTTPRPVPLIRTLLADPRTHVTRGTTYDNAAHLAPSALAALRERYEHTRIGRQELLAEVLDDIPGALWTRAMIRIGQAPELQRVVVAVDPSGSDGQGGDSIGIVVAGKGIDGRYYVLEDATCRLSPDGWARRVIDRYRAHRADRIIAERNFGGEMVAATIRTADARAPVRLVSASRGKVVRAEPVAALYEQERVTHAPGLELLEDQMLQMTSSGYVGEGSPDRVDALVWALTELALAPQSAGSTGTVLGAW